MSTTAKKKVFLFQITISLFFILVLSSIIFPTDFVFIKMIFLTLLLFFISFNRLTYSKPIFLWTLSFITLGLVWTLFGGIMDNPGAFRTTTVMVIYPLLFFILSNVFLKLDDIKMFNTMLLISAFFVVLVQVSFLLSAYEVFPYFIADFFVSNHPGFAVLDFGENYLLFTLPNVSSLLFLIPYLSAYILLSQKLKYKYMFLLLIMLVLMLLTGRRTFFLSYFISILFFIILVVHLNSYIKINIKSKIIKSIFIMMLI